MSDSRLTLAAVHLPCADQEKMRAFYCDVLGLEPGEEQVPIGDGSMDPWITLQTGQVYVVLKPRAGFDGDPRPDGSASVHLGLRMANREVLDEAYDELTKHDIEFRSPPKDWPWGERAFFFLDPEGNLVEYFAS